MLMLKLVSGKLTNESQIWTSLEASFILEL